MHSHDQEYQLLECILLGEEARPLPFQILCEVKNEDGRGWQALSAQTHGRSPQRTHMSKASGVSKLFTQSRRELRLTLQLTSTRHTLPQKWNVLDGKELRVLTWKLQTFELAFCKQPVSVSEQILKVQLYLLDRTPHHYVYTARHHILYLSIHRCTACWISKHILPEI